MVADGGADIGAVCRWSAESELVPLPSLPPLQVVSRTLSNKSLTRDPSLKTESEAEESEIVEKQPEAAAASWSTWRVPSWTVWQVPGRDGSCQVFDSVSPFFSFKICQNKILVIRS